MSRRVSPCCTVRGPVADLGRHLSTTIFVVASIRRKQLVDGTTTYLVRFRVVDGTERSKQFRRKRDADAYANLIEVDRAAGSAVDPRLGRTTVSQWWDEWWPTVTNLRRTTYARDEQYFRSHVLPTYANVSLARIDRTDLRRWVQKLSAAKADGGSGLAPATVQKVVQVFNKCLRAALEDRRITSNPLDHLPLPKIERKEMRFLTVDEVWTLADNIDQRYRAFVLVASYGGLRLGELLALRWGRVNLLSRQVDVVETLTDVNGHLAVGPPKTRAAVRQITLPRFVCDELAILAVDRPSSDDLVFRSPDGYFVRAGLFRQRIWHDAVKKSGLDPLRIHDLRHTAISLWIAAGANHKQVAVRAGHTSVSVVLDRYGHLYPKHDDELIDNLQQRATASRQQLPG